MRDRALRKWAYFFQEAQGGSKCETKRSWRESMRWILSVQQADLRRHATHQHQPDLWHLAPSTQFASNNSLDHGDSRLCISPVNDGGS